MTGSDQRTLFHLQRMFDTGSAAFVAQNQAAKRIDMF